MAGGLTFKIERKGEWDVVAFAGPINESAEKVLKDLEKTLGKRCLFDFGGIISINSCGLAEWVLFLDRVSPGRSLVFDRCTPPVVDCLNMTPAFKGPAVVRSVFGEFQCTNKHFKLKLIPVEHALKDGGASLASTCSQCQAQMQPTFEVADHFAFAREESEDEAAGF